MSEPSPYPGPRAFEPKEEKMFRGRKKETADLYNLVLAHPVTLLFSQSGAGKTSLINAGLSPRLVREGVKTRRLRVGLRPHGENLRSRRNVNVFVSSAVQSSGAAA